MTTGLPPFYSRDKDDMYDRIRFGGVKYPSYMSIELKDLIEHLLIKNPEKRLGGRTAGSKDIRSHKWFENVNWEAYLRKEVRPPFCLKIKSEIDVSYFDPVY